MITLKCSETKDILRTDHSMQLLQTRTNLLKISMINVINLPIQLTIIIQYPCKHACSCNLIKNLGQFQMKSEETVKNALMQTWFPICHLYYFNPVLLLEPSDWCYSGHIHTKLTIYIAFDRFVIFSHCLMHFS